MRKHPYMKSYTETVRINTNWALERNMTDLFPPAFIAAKAMLQDIFADEAATLGINAADAERLFRLLPASVRAAQAVKFKLGDPDWRYIFGKPFHIGESRGFGIPHQAPLVVNLIRATAVAESRLTPTQRRSWWWQIDTPGNHLDAVFEMLAVSNVDREHNLTYEPASLAVGSQRIDWLLNLNLKDEHSFLLEVKNRPGQTAQEMTRIKSSSRTTGPVDEPITDFDALFKSTYSKFLPVPDPSRTQGVMLFVGIKIPAARFEKFFNDHLQTTLDFIDLGKEDKETGTKIQLLARSSEVASRVLSAFGWREGADLTYNDLEGT